MKDYDFWEKSCVIYVITNLMNGMQYVGQTVNKLKCRIQHHKKYNEFYLGNAIRQYGWENFKVDILEECGTLKELNEQEAYWIKTLGCKFPNGYNLTDGGNAPKGRVVSDKERMLRSEMNPYKRPVRCIDTGEIFPSVTSAARHFGITHSLVSAVCRGKQITSAGHRFEYVDQPLSLEEKQRKPQKPHTRKVCCVECDKIFNTIVEVAQCLKVNAAHITQVCRGQRKQTGGYHWNYVD